MYPSRLVCVCMPAIAERLRRAYPALPEWAGVGSIPVGPHSHSLGKLQLSPAGDHSIIPQSMHGHKDRACFRTTAPFPEACTATRHKDACYKLGVCNRQGTPGLGSPLFYISTWAMVWPNDYPALAT